MRPTHLVSIVLAAVLALGGIAFTVLVFVDRDAGRPWHYWIAPVMAIQFALLLVALGVGYYLRALRPETKGRPPSG